MAVPDQTFADAEKHGQEKRAAGYAVAARYDRRSGRVVVKLNTDVQFSFPARLAEGLSQASSDALAVIEITPSGLALHWPELDADLYISGLLAGDFGGKRWMAAQLSAAGDQARAPKKIVRSRESARNGSRPRKVAARS